MNQQLLFPSEIIHLSVRQVGEGDDVRICEYPIHKTVLIQLPYFEAMLSERWTSTTNHKTVSFELPPLSTLEDFAMFLSMLYSNATCKTMVVTETNAERLVGLYALSTMLQARELAKQLAAKMKQVTSTSDKVVHDRFVSKLEQYSTFDEVCNVLKTVQPTIDKKTLKRIVNDCYDVETHSTILKAALTSRATFGYLENDLILIYSHMHKTYHHDNLHVPIILEATYPKRLSKQHSEFSARFILSK